MGKRGHYFLVWLALDGRSTRGGGAFYADTLVARVCEPAPCAGAAIFYIVAQGANALHELCDVVLGELPREGCVGITHLSLCVCRGPGGGGAHEGRAALVPDGRNLGQRRSVGGKGLRAPETEPVDPPADAGTAATAAGDAAYRAALGHIRAHQYDDALSQLAVAVDSQTVFLADVR